MRGENWSTRGKTSHSRVENQQTQSTFDVERGNRTRAIMVAGKCSHHYANPATSDNVVPAGCLVNSLLFFAIVVVGLALLIGCVVGLVVGDAVVQLSLR